MIYLALLKRVTGSLADRALKIWQDLWYDPIWRLTASAVLVVIIVRRG